MTPLGWFCLGFAVGGVAVLGPALLIVREALRRSARDTLPPVADGTHPQQRRRTMWG
jgi:hypothetical protein